MPTNESMTVSYIERSAPSTRNAKVQAFNRGKEAAYADALEFCRQGLGNLGEEILLSVRAQMQSTAERIRMEVTETVESNQLNVSSQLELLHTRVQSLANSEHSKQAQSHESRSVHQNEASRMLVMRREEQIVQIHEQLSRMLEHISKIQKKSDMDLCMEHLAGKIDVQKMLDVQTMNLMQNIQKLQLGAPDLSMTLQELQATGPPQDLDFSPVISEIRRAHVMIEEDMQTMMREIAKIQQHLQLDFLPIGPSACEATPRSVVESEATIESVVVQPKAVSFAEAEEEPTSDDGRCDTVTSEMDVMKFSHMASKVKKLKRVREMGAQTEQAYRDTHAQTDADFHKPHQHKKHRPSAEPKKNAKPLVPARPGGLQDQDAFKEKARRALLKPQYNVLDYYHTTGICQRIARSMWFDNLTVAIVGLNAIWISIDIDYNQSILLMEADAIFQVVENTFCTYFFFEISIRFGAFAKKRQAFLDPWFLFDLLLVTNMVAETWLVPIVIAIVGSGADVLNVSFLRMMRMVKLLRLSRVTRFIRAVPELIIIVKAMGFAARSVMVFFFVWLVIIYVYAVVLRQATDGSEVGDLLFPTVPDAMNSLLLDGLLADYSPFMKSLGSAGALLYIVGLTYILLVAVTVMYMLVGCLVEAVGAIASSQKEGLVVSYVAGSIRNKMEQIGHNPEAPISQQDFQNYLTDSEVAGILQSVKVDVVVLADMLEMFYEDLERTGDVMTFEKMIELMLNGRGSNTATVRDTKELLRMIKSAIRVQTAETTKKLAEELSSVQQTINAMREEAMFDDSDSSFLVI
ncbi:DUSP9 [Symbiodinium natans]|uniref:DUSP9 protein n=1 Tax=Symbiodinium natans TaxID=878477 RepID=A0A812R5R5_9DINO|nr:DUSP9 [Symbiodinium natans]